MKTDEQVDKGQTEEKTMTYILLSPKNKPNHDSKLQFLEGSRQHMAKPSVDPWFDNPYNMHRSLFTPYVYKKNLGHGTKNIFKKFNNH